LLEKNEWLQQLVLRIVVARRETRRARRWFRFR